MSEQETANRQSQSDLLLWIAAGAIVAIAAAWFVITQLGSAPTAVGEAASADDVPQLAVLLPSDPAPVASAGRDAGAAPAGSEAASEDAGSAAGAGSLSDPLRAARMAFDAGMLLEPARFSAWSLYGDALDANPANADAIAGLRTVAAALLTRANSALEQGRYDDASAIADRILDRLPGDGEADRIRQAVLAEQARQQALADRRAREAEARAAAAAAGEARAASDAARDASLEELNASFEAAVATNRLLAPAGDSARDYLREMRDLAADDERTAAASNWLVTEMLGRSRQATEATDWAAAQTWIDEAAALGADGRLVGEHAEYLRTGMAATESAKRLPASEFELVRYVQPEYPRNASSRGIEGWVDLDFRVTVDGSTADVTITDASHQRMFDSAALEAVAQWQFEPRQFMGGAIEQNAYTRLRFVLAD